MSQKPRNLSDMTLVNVISLCTAMHLANQCSIIASARNATYFLMETPSWPSSVVDTDPSAICDRLCLSGNAKLLNKCSMLIWGLRRIQKHSGGDSNCAKWGLPQLSNQCGMCSSLCWFYEHCDAMKWRCCQLQTSALSSTDSPLDLGQFYADARYAEAECW